MNMRFWWSTEISTFPGKHIPWCFFKMIWRWNFSFSRYSCSTYSCNQDQVSPPRWYMNALAVTYLTSVFIVGRFWACTYKWSLLQMDFFINSYTPIFSSLLLRLPFASATSNSSPWYVDMVYNSLYWRYWQCTTLHTISWPDKVP